jgi:hypothetical protein
MDRHARQRSLAAVGDAGQARIVSATYRVAGDAAANVARDYLRRAGAERFEPASEPLEPFTHAPAFRHAAARDFAEGAWRALRQLRVALENAP